MTKLLEPSDDDIGDIPLSMEFIREHNLSFKQIFRSHTHYNAEFLCKLCDLKVRYAHVFVSHLVTFHNIKIDLELVSFILELAFIDDFHIY